jgi:hypothetical protein
MARAKTVSLDHVENRAALVLHGLVNNSTDMLEGNMLVLHKLKYMMNLFVHLCSSKQYMIHLPFCW